MVERLREIPRVRQPEGSVLRRRWFASPTVDLFVWEGESGVERFELSYDNPRNEHAWHWTREAGLSHWRIDDGEGHPLANNTPIAVRDREDPRPDVAALAFEAIAGDIDVRTYRAIMKALWLER